MIKLSILICTMPSRAAMLGRLKTELWSQMLPYADDVEMLIDDSPVDTIGEKRNRLLGRASGKMISFIDDDDRVSSNYVSLLMGGVGKDVDCCSLLGVITTNGKDPHYFEHSIKYSAYETIEGTDFGKREIHYLRYPNHISCIRAEIAKSFKFPEKNWGEDTDWATQINESGLLKKEHYIEEVIYYYDYLTSK